MIDKSALSRGLAVVVSGLTCVGIQGGAAVAEQGAEASLLGQVLENATYESKTVMTAFPRAVHQADSSGIEDEPVEAWTHLSLDSTTFLDDYWTFGLGVEALASTYRGAERGAFSAPGVRKGHGRYVDLSRMTLSYLGDTVEVLAGKDAIPIGLAEIYSPTDLYGAENTANPQQPVDYGVWQLRTDLYVGSDRLTGIILPIEESAPGPAEHSRWNGPNGSGGSDFANLNITGLPLGISPEIVDDYRDSTPSNWSYLLQYKGTATNLDYFITAYNGVGPYPVLKNPASGQFNPYTKVYPTVSIASAGSALVQGSWKFYGEGLAYWAEEDTDDDFARALIGAKYRETQFANSIGWKEITPIIEYSKEWRFGLQDHPDYNTSSKEARPNPNNVLMSLTVEANDEWKFGGMHGHSLQDWDSTSQVFARYQPNDNLWTMISFVEYHGNEGTQFGRYDRNDNVSLTVNYSF